MDDEEALSMMARCKDEVILLRAQIARLAPKAEAYDAMLAILNLTPNRQPVGMGEDILWIIGKAQDAARERVTKCRRHAPVNANEVDDGACVAENKFLINGHDFTPVIGDPLGQRCKKCLSTDASKTCTHAAKS